MQPALIVILGAGASAASGHYHWRGGIVPPLTAELFDEAAYEDQLAGHPLAQQAGRLINRRRAADDALALEQALRELATSDHSHHRLMALDVPLYLQDLLIAVSTELTAHAFRFDDLIESVLRLERVFFLTLNYDLLLDRRLASFHPLRTLGDYVAEDKNWSLLKLHGSVNWYFRTEEPLDRSRPGPDLHWDPETISCDPTEGSLERCRETRSYPALALPEGPEDRLVLSALHQEFAEERLAAAREANLLVIGYSGLDGEVLALLGRSGVRVRKMTVVDRDTHGAQAVVARFAAAGIESIWPAETAERDFAVWSDFGGAGHLVETYEEAPSI
jgi:hypothetical protein